MTARYEARSCGEVRKEPKAPKVTRYSGRVTIDVQYLAPGESWDTPNAQYAFTVWAEGKRVNTCSFGLPGCPPPERERYTPEAYDEAAASAVRWTLHELSRGNVPDAVMDEQDLDGILEHDEDYNVIVHRTVRAAEESVEKRYGKSGRY